MTLRARKRFGQHFLVDDAVIDRVVDAVAPKPGDALVEIGPGRGAITRPLLEQCGHLTVIELDRDLAARWRRTPALQVIEADALAVDFASLAAQRPGAGADGSKLRVVGNLPYNISTPILFHLLTAAASIQDQHVMLQKEVVHRMAASPGGKTYGRLSVMLQWRYHIEHLFDVAADAFEPPPRVESAMARMIPRVVDPKAGSIVEHGSHSRLLGEIVTVAFSQRRKLLRHSLGRWLGERGIDAAFNLQRRAEEVGVDEYVALASAASAVIAAGAADAAGAE